MCTAISFTTDKHFFGRNLDLNYNYPQTGIFVPRNYKITFKKEVYETGEVTFVEL